MENVDFCLFVFWGKKLDVRIIKITYDYNWDVEKFYFRTEKLVDFFRINLKMRTLLSNQNMDKKKRKHRMGQSKSLTDLCFLLEKAFFWHIDAICQVREKNPAYSYKPSWATEPRAKCGIQL